MAEHDSNSPRKWCYATHNFHDHCIAPPALYVSVFSCGGISRNNIILKRCQLKSGLGERRGEIGYYVALEHLCSGISMKPWKVNLLVEPLTLASNQTLGRSQLSPKFPCECKCVLWTFISTLISFFCDKNSASWIVTCLRIWTFKVWFWWCLNRITEAHGRFVSLSKWVQLPSCKLHTSNTAIIKILVLFNMEKFTVHTFFHTYITVCTRLWI